MNYEYRRIEKPTSNPNESDYGMGVSASDMETAAEYAAEEDAEGGGIDLTELHPGAIKTLYYAIKNVDDWEYVKGNYKVFKVDVQLRLEVDVFEESIDAPEKTTNA